MQANIRENAVSFRSDNGVVTGKTAEQRHKSQENSTENNFFIHFVC